MKFTSDIVIGLELKRSSLNLITFFSFIPNPKQELFGDLK